MFKTILIQLHKNLEILREREAKYGGNAPLDLIHQINDHLHAIELIQEILLTNLLETRLQELKSELKFLLLPENILKSIEQAVFTPPLFFEPETVFIPAGFFFMGSRPADNIPDYELPQCQIYLPAYQIGKYPITNEQYAQFINQTERSITSQMGWEGQKPPEYKLNHPVAGVSWYDALAYCQWLSQQTGRFYTLPSEAQWEKAARGTDERIYPWGNEWDIHRCHCGYDHTAPVDAYPAQSIYGCYDLVGNVREWTSTLWGENRLAPDPQFHYPWSNDKREDLTAKSHFYRVYRGGAAADNPTHLRCSARNGYAPNQPGPPHKRFGFRVVLKPSL